MRNNYLMIICSFALLLVCSAAFAQNIVVLDGVEVRGDSFIIKIQPGVAAPAFANGLQDAATPAGQVLAAAGAVSARPLHANGFANPVLARQLGMDRTFFVELNLGANIAIALNAVGLRRDLFEVVEPNAVFRTTLEPDDPDYGRQWALENTGQTGGTVDADIDAEAAWDVSTGSRAIRVAILDTGLDRNHPEFAGRVVAGQNFLGGATPGAWDDDEDHGTHVTGIAVARGDNGRGIAGVCWDCSIMVGKVCDASNDCFTQPIADSLRWAADNGASVINMSFAGPGDLTAIEDAIQYAWAQGVLLVAASGNTGDAVVQFPAGYPEVIAVGNTDDNDGLQASSSRGPHLELSAPGTRILSTIRRGGYGILTGTSMAAPHVAGLAGLILSEDPTLTSQQVRDLLIDSVDDLGPRGRDPGFGFGRINAGRAMSLARSDVTWVRFSYSGPEDGSFGRPFNTLAEGVANAPCGSTIRVIGSSSETGVFSRPADCPVNIESWDGSATIGG